MRLLNSYEQQICLRILNGDGNNNYLGNLIDDRLDGVRISITRNPQMVDLLFTTQNAQPIPAEIDASIERMREISVEILTVVNLITLLEKDGYIMLLQRTNQVPNTSTFGRGVSNMPFISSAFSDTKISQLLLEYYLKEIYVTKEFRRFCRSNFIARDEQRYRRQITVTSTALVVAALALVTNTFFNLLPRFTGGTMIRQDQIDSLRHDLQGIRQSINVLNDTIVALPSRPAYKREDNLKDSPKPDKVL